MLSCWASERAEPNSRVGSVLELSWKCLHVVEEDSQFEFVEI